MAFILLDKTGPPLNDRIVDPKGWLTDLWRQWFGRMPATLAAIPSVLNVVSLSEQAASITATDFAGTSLLEGRYRLSYHARISQAGTVSSSLTVALGWTEGGVAQAYTGAAMTGNTTATNQSGSVIIRGDADGAVTYTTTYASVGATAMEYSLDLVLEKIKDGIT